MPNDPKNPTPQQLQAALILSWGADTSHKFGDWVHTVPSLGQDVVTALVVQDFYGGTIWRAPLPCYLRSHHWNVDTRYATLDFTGGHLVYMVRGRNVSARHCWRTLTYNAGIKSFLLVWGCGCDGYVKMTTISRNVN